MLQNKLLRVACAGAGYFSRFHYDAWTRLPRASIVGICNRSIDKAKDLAEQYGIEHVCSDLQELLDRCKPNVLDLITPPHTHVNAVKISAENGVDVICQKPFGENLEQAKLMVNIADESGIKLIIHENFRFMPWFRQVKSMLNRNDLGELLSAEFKFRPGDGQGDDAYLARQPYFQQMSKFLIHETAIHFVDTFRFLFGEPRSLYARLRRCNPAIRGEDAGIVIFEFPNNLEVVFSGNRLLDHRSSNTRRTMGELEIIGTQGELRLDGEARLWLRDFGTQDAREISYAWQDKNFGGDCVFNTIQHIYQHYLNELPVENEARHYLANIAIENAIYQSAENGRELTL